MEFKLPSKNPTPRCNQLAVVFGAVHDKSKYIMYDGKWLDDLEGVKVGKG